MNADVVIAGAGIIGLSCAFELKRRGFSVIVLERGHAMREASWAAAGMLAAHDPHNPPALLPLAERSLELYPAYLARIAEASGLSVPFRTEATLQVLPAAESIPGPQHRVLSPAEAASLLPDINQRVVFALLREWSLDPRGLCSALPRAMAAAGVMLREGVAVDRVRPGHGSVEVAAGDVFTAAAFVNCCGAWASSLCPAAYEGAHEQVVPHVAPRKGQMAVIHLDPPERLPIVLRSGDIYMVPRGDGRILVGATVEDAGFDTTIHSGTTETLLARAAELWPPVLEGKVVDQWAGLRPATEDGLPILGESGEAGCFWATGHFRNGILLAPATAEAIADCVEGRRAAVELAHFAPSRFSAVA